MNHATKHAIETIKQLATLFGDGFHIDTPMGDYVDADGNRLLTAGQSVYFENVLQTALDCLEDAGLDPCDAIAE